jgi:PhoH-like ATPase
MTRVTVPVGEDIGFLPGTEEEKMDAVDGRARRQPRSAQQDRDEEGGDWGRAATRDLIRSRIKIKSLNFMRGRTFLNKFLIIDEAQNLTPKQMKTLITRAGPGTKVICMGNIAQIDTPYLTEGSSGLTYVVDRFKGWPHSGHVTLQRGERSRLRRPRGRSAKPMRLIQWLPLITPFKAVFVRHGLVAFAVEVS